jgi:hypothetical protein
MAKNAPPDGPGKPTGSPARTGLLPYQEISEPDYATEAAKTFQLDKIRVGMWALRGSCPRCRAHLEILVVYDVVVKGRTAPTGPEQDDNEPVMCTCDEPHPGRPQGQLGCGAYWIFALPADRT